VIDLGHPMFASCFGFQMLVQALGGHIIPDPENAEVGAFELHLTHEALTDELFSVLPPVFMAQLGHKERAERFAKATLDPYLSSSTPVTKLHSLYILLDNHLKKVIHSAV